MARISASTVAPRAAADVGVLEHEQGGPLGGSEAVPPGIEGDGVLSGAVAAAEAAGAGEAHEGLEAELLDAPGEDGVGTAKRIRSAA